MTDLHNHLNNEARNIRMTEEEKRAMRMRLMAALDTSPAHAAPRRSPYVFLFAPRSLAVLGLALLLVVSTGTAYAAEGSLPGAPLYSVKVNVMEPLAVALAPSPAAKAQVHADLAVRRVEEAQTLAAEGTLTPQAAQEISDNYNAHAQAALTLAQDVDAANGSVTSATTTETEDATTTQENHPAVAVAPKAAMKTMMTMSTTVAPTASSSEKGEVNATVTARVVPQATTTPIAPGLAGKLHAALSAEANILKSINARVREHMDDTQSTSTASSTSTTSPMRPRHATSTQGVRMMSTTTGDMMDTMHTEVQSDTETKIEQNGTANIKTKSMLRLQDVTVPRVLGGGDSGDDQ